jgi:hypothetical protein
MVLLVAGVAVGVWYLVWDMFLMEPLLGSMVSGIPGLVAEPPMLWMVVGELAAGLVLAAVYARVRSIFGTGFKGGAIYGTYAGVLINFPTWLMLAVFVGWPYATMWAFTIAGIVLTAVAGGLIGMVYAMMEKPKAA